MAPREDPRDPGGHFKRQFDKLDTNKDGWLSSGTHWTETGGLNR